MKKLNAQWFNVPKCNKSTKLLLYCFPYAGGSAYIFERWKKKLSDEIELLGIQLPGRGIRMAEKPITSIHIMADILANKINQSSGSTPYAFFGHSMGATLAHEIILRIQNKKSQSSQIKHLFVSASKAPQLANTNKQIHKLSDMELIEELRQYNGTSAEIFEDQELLKQVLPTVRADFQASENYIYENSKPISTNITVFGGTNDQYVNRNELMDWKYRTNKNFQIHMLQGDHFFIFPQEDYILSSITKNLKLYQ